jgi:hypothetical protein
MSLNNLLGPNNYELNFNQNKNFNDTVFSIYHQVVPAQTDRELVNFIYDGAIQNIKSATIVYNYSSGVLGTLTMRVTDETKAITYFTHTFTAGGSGDQEFQMTKGVDMPSNQQKVYFVYTTDAPWNHPADIIKSLNLFN